MNCCVFEPHFNIELYTLTMSLLYLNENFERQKQLINMHLQKQLNEFILSRSNTTTLAYNVQSRKSILNFFNNV